MDTTYVYNQVKIPAKFHTIVGNFPDTVNVQGKVGLYDDISTSIDSIHYSLNQLVSVGEAVRDYGTGFNDTVAIIVFDYCSIRLRLPIYLLGNKPYQ